MESVTNIKESVKGDVVILRVKGKLDTILSPQVEKKGIQLMHAGQMKLVLDLSEISYVNSAGLRMLLSLKKQMKSAGGKFIVCSLRPEVMEIMKICGFDHVLEFAKDDEDALRQF
jgi:anti-anti-sigma factor